MKNGCRMLIRRQEYQHGEKIVVVLNEMSEYLSIPQMKKLQEVIIRTFTENEVAKRKYQMKNS